MQGVRAWSGKRVLVVDDDPIGRSLVVLRLREAGFVVETASAAADALGMTAADPPDAILSDLRMPGMDGLELCQVIRQDVRLASIPFLLLSSALAPCDRQRALDLGASGVFLRSPGLGDVVDTLAAALG